MNEAARTESPAELLPNNAYDAKLLANTRPSGWKNPRPCERAPASVSVALPIP